MEDNLYDVKYRRGLLWRKLKVKGDFTMNDLRVRVFVLEDDTRIEIPMEFTEFSFSPRRQHILQAAAKKGEAEKNG